MKRPITGVFIFLTALVTLTGSAAAVDFPGRQEAKYSQLKTIEIDALHKDYLDHKAIIIDVRSTLEFDTIHVKDSKHLSLSDKGFGDKLKDIAVSGQGKKIAFY